MFNTQTITFCWPEGKVGAVTSSWDDGTADDYRLVELFDRYGFKATWNLNSPKLGVDERAGGWRDHVKPEDVATLYQRHEVAAHTLNHPRPWTLPPAQLAVEILADRHRLEDLVGYPVTGFCFPFGRAEQSDALNDIARACGVRYARASQHRLPAYDLPADFMSWGVSGHYTIDLEALWDGFLGNKRPDKLFNFWGHSYECTDREDWDRLERFLQRASETGDLWHATNGEICDYVSAWKQLQSSVDGRFLRNPTALTLWLHRNGELCQVAPAATLSASASTVTNQA